MGTDEREAHGATLQELRRVHADGRAPVREMRQATDESFTRLTDPDLLGSARFGPRKYIEPLSVPLHGAAP